MLRLTKKGQALHDQPLAVPITQAAQQRMLNVLAPAERRSLREMLQRVIKANRKFAFRPGAGRRASSASRRTP